METNLQSSEVRIPKSPQLPNVCPQFKSTFARSLSFNTSSQPIKPLDFEISLRIAQNVDHLQNLCGSSTTHKVDEVDDDFEEFMRNSPLKQSLQNVSGKSTTPTPPTRKNVITSRVFNTNCSGRNRFQVNLSIYFFLFVAKNPYGHSIVYFFSNSISFESQKLKRDQTIEFRVRSVHELSFY